MATSTEATTAQQDEGPTPAPAPPLPSPPFIPVEGLPNFRDIGGYPIPGSARKMVRRGLVYRSSEPSRLTDAGVARLRDLGVAKVYDLRSALEVERSAAAAAASSSAEDGEKEASEGEGGNGNGNGNGPKRVVGAGAYAVKEWEGAERVFVPVFLEEDYSPEAIALRFRNFAHEGSEGFVRAYTRILHLGAQESHPYQPFRTILSHLSQPGRPAAVAPVLIHCTAGKDRTGVIVALLLSLAGLPDDAVAHEYALTDAGLASRKPEFVRALVASPALRGDREGAVRMVSSRKENMLATLRVLREKYGSARGYVTGECGLSEEEVDRLVANLVEDVPEGEEGERMLLDWERHAEEHERFVERDN